MMSYLWILLLGSLLAASAKAQDDAGPGEEEAAPATSAPDVEATPEADADHAADEETHHTDEEVITTPSPSEPTVAPGGEADDAAAPADGDAEAATPADAAGDAEAVTPAAGDEDAAAPTEGDAEPATPTAAADTEEDAAVTTQEPAGDPEVKDTDAEQPTANGDEEPTGATPAPGHDEATPAKDPAAGDNEEEPTDPAADSNPTQHLGTVAAPTIKVDVAPEVHADSGFNLEDALGGGDAGVDPVQPGKSRSLEPGAHAAGATGEADKPEAQEASSGSLAAILSTLAVGIVGSVTGYFAYQKKKLCFKNRQEADPEAARKADAAEAQSDPQVLSNLLNSS